MRAVPTIERVQASVVLDPYLSLRGLATYSGLSVRTLRGYIDKLPDEALPAYRVGGKILVRRSEFDLWISRYRSHGRPTLAQAVKALGLKATAPVEPRHAR